MDLIELFINAGIFKKRITYLMHDVALGTHKVTYANVNQMLGPTFPPRIVGNTVLLSYEGVSFVFEYSEKEFKEGVNELHPDGLQVLDNRLVKINLNLANDNE